MKSEQGIATQVKILFVLRGKDNNRISPFILEQIESLKNMDIDVDIFQIKGKGLFAYFFAIKKLRQDILRKEFDIIHAHYGLSAWTALFTLTGKPLIVSLMGSDVLGEYISENKISLKSRMVVLLTQIVQYFVDYIIVKSDNISSKIRRKKILSIIPNGVNLDKVYPKDFVSTRKKLGIKENEVIILFLDNIENPWKNFDLTKKAVELLDNKKVKLLTPYPVLHQEVVDYLNAANVLVHTSYMEGSSNIIKEAMACNCPMVATNVGDTEWIIGKTKGCFLSTFSSEDVAAKLGLALDFSENIGRTNGVERIKQLKLDTQSTAKKIQKTYQKILNKN